MIYLIDYLHLLISKKMPLYILLKILLRKYIFFYRIYQNRRFYKEGGYYRIYT